MSVTVSSYGIVQEVTNLKCKVKNNLAKITFTLHDDGETRLGSFTLPTDEKQIQQRNLGHTQQTCRICGASGKFQSWLGVEQFIGTKDTFPYFVCPECECLQIAQVPENLGKYYSGSEYYSFAKPPIVLPEPGVKPKDDVVLDVGCGNGMWLCQQAEEGYRYLFGCDPFIAEDLQYHNGVQIRKCTIHDMVGQFDLVRLGDAFEHVTDPLETLQSMKRLMKPGGKGLLRLPFFPSLPFDIYGPFWYGMDAPRHITLHSVKSIAYLANKVGLDANIAHGTNTYDFALSSLYLKDYRGVEFFKGSEARRKGMFSENLYATYNEAQTVCNLAKYTAHVDITLTIPKVDTAVVRADVKALLQFLNPLEKSIGSETPEKNMELLEKAFDCSGRLKENLSVNSQTDETAHALIDMILDALAFLYQAAQNGTLKENAFLLADVKMAAQNLEAVFSL